MNDSTNIVIESPADRRRRLLASSALVSGIVLLCSGASIMGVHYWPSMSRLLRFGLIDVAILSLVIVVVWKGLDSISGKFSIFLASLLTGGFIALYGYVYQVGLMTPKILFWWIMLIIGWAIIAKLPVLWVMLIVLFDAVLATSWHRGIYRGWGIVLFEEIFFLNALALVVWELFAGRNVSWLRNRWWPRLLFASSLVFIVVAVVHYFAYQSLDELIALELDGAFLPVLFACAMGLSLWYYKKRRKDLVIIIMTLSSILVALIAFFVRVAKSL